MFSFSGLSPFHLPTFNCFPCSIFFFNFFNDKKAAVDEMIRVAKPGARILIADETERGARGYEKFIPGFKKSFGGKRDVIAPPLDLVPETMLETRVFDVWKGWLYCIEFRKP
jgi:ubiquinone/menaquinone biosynthesis C-methylase UbiE